MSDDPLSSVVIAFDVDNTLVDPSGESYRRTVTESLSRVDLELGADKAFDVHETVRSHGHALERLGLANPIHQRGHPQTFALLCLTRCANPVLLGELHITRADQQRYKALLTEINDMHLRAVGQVEHLTRARSRSSGFQPDLQDASTKCRALVSLLHAERNVRTWLRVDAGVQRFREDMLRIAEHRLATQWAAVYRALDCPQPLNAVRELLEALAARGATPVVITEGRTGIQLDKLDRARLLEAFGGRILVSSAASDVPGIGQLDEALSQRLSAMDGAPDDRALALDDELVLLWHYRCLIDAWGSKTPWFYARCLHALQRDRRRPDVLLRRPLYIPPDQWRGDPLYFVMVGDRYDKDVEPLVDLLDPGVALKIRLRMGKYGDLHPDAEIPVDRRPDRTFTDWDSLADFLANELSVEDVKAITTPPHILPRQNVSREIVERGLGSEFEAVRVVAHVLAEMMRCES